ncbi:MAG: outer rane immunogenic protein [Verrucomicrobiota bacterium]|jgi:opacity protein-like surface antigen
MKKLTLTLGTLCAGCALTFGGTAQTSSKEVMEQAPVAITSCFQGWYFGIHGGGLLTNLNSDTSADGVTTSARGDVTSATDFSTGDNNDGMAEGGLHAGYNFQRGGWIFGLEVDISVTDLEKTNSALAVVPLDQEGEVNAPFEYATAITSKTDLNWYSTVRPRFGHTLGQRVFVYGTGGLAFGLTEVSEITGVAAATPQGGTVSALLSDSDRGVAFGWTAGAGIDFCLTEHIILNFTYLYVDLGDSSASSSFSGASAPVSAGVRTYDSATHVTSDMKFHVIQGGLSFRF